MIRREVLFMCWNCSSTIFLYVTSTQQSQQDTLFAIRATHKVLILGTKDERMMAENMHLGLSI